MSTSKQAGSIGITKKLALSALLLVTTSLFFLGDHLNPGKDRIITTAISAILLLILTILLHRSTKFHEYWEVAFAFFCGAFGLFLAWSTPSAPLSNIGGSTDTPQGVAILKFFELLPVALTIIVLTRIVQGSLTPIYVQKGNLKSGIGLGLLLGIIILVIYLAISWSNIDPIKMVSALPWLIAFAFLNAFFEELLIRGLFLRRYIVLFGPSWAVVLSALCYGLFFLGVQAAVGPISYSTLVVILPLGLIFGFIIQNSDSIWGAVSLHAVVDLIFLIGVFASV